MNRFIFWGLLCSTFLASTATLHAAPSYFPTTGHYYEGILVPEGITWNDARDAAESLGGYLATITSEAENTFVFNLIDDPSFYTAPSIANDLLGPWLGGYTTLPAPWQWITGEPFIYTNWEFNQPDGAFGTEQRLQFYKYNATYPGSTWADHPGGEVAGYQLPRGFVVEYVPEPRAVVLLLFSGITLLSIRIGRAHTFGAI
jgi:hypothetical protein